MEHVRQGIAAGTGGLVNDHHLWSIDTGNWRCGWLAVTLHEIAHQLSIQLVHNIIRDLSTVIITLVDDRAVFVLLRVIITSEVCIARACSVRQPNVSQPAVDRKSTRLNSSHLVISYAVFCLKK